MRILNYLITMCIVFACAFSNSYGQKTEELNKDWSVEMGGTFVIYDSEIQYHTQAGYGGYLKLEKILDDNFVLYGSYHYLQSLENDSYFMIENYPYSVRGSAVKYSNSVNLGANWYILSSDIANDFSPYLGLGFMLNLNKINLDVYPDWGTETNYHMYVALVPTLGFNIPISGSIGLGIAGQYIYSIGDKRYVRNNRDKWRTCIFNLGVKYSF